MNIKEIKECLKYLSQTDITAFIIGHAGVGKSAAGKQFADEIGYNFLDVRAGQMADAGDLMGLPDFLMSDGQKIGTKFIKPSYLPDSGKWVIFLDEVNRALPDVRQALFQLVLDRRLHEYVVPKDCIIIAAGNPDTSDYVVNSFNDAAWADRFCFLKADYDHETWIDYAKSESTLSESYVLDFMIERPEMISFTHYEDYSLDFVKPTPRSIHLFAKVDKLNPPISTLRQIGQGLVGTEYTIAYMEFKKSNENMIKAKDVIENYSKVKDKVKKIQNRGDIIHLVSKDIVKFLEKAKKHKVDQLENIRRFILDIPRDIGKAMIVQCLQIESLHNKQVRNALVDHTDLFDYLKEVI